MWSDAPLLDADAVDRLLQLGGTAFLRELVSLFTAQGAQRVTSIEQALTRGDLDTVRRGAHSLVSTAGNLGTRRLQRLAGALEGAAHAHDVAALTTLVAALGPVFEGSRAALLAREAELAG
ncbi:MAG: Hpt domain-containing protein [Gemmatimonadaceae bacterium]|jgi:HPt (histidine-containing phosphotransfer) domain-containing protein|nr:Hpt domain-containing protein [Gemmatimonadaceae bacterium]